MPIGTLENEGDLEQWVKRFLDRQGIRHTTPAVGGGGGAPSAHASTHASGGSDPVTLAQSQVTNLVTDLSGKAASVHTHAESDVTGLVADLAAKAPLASPALTGNPTAPTPAAADNDTSIATTAFVQGELAAKAPLASPTFTGDPKAPTPTAGDSDTSIATTAFVTTADGLLVPKSLFTTKGDLVVATASGVVARRGVGTDGQVLTADSAQSDGVRWATPAATTQVFPWIPIFDAQVNLTAAGVGTYLAHRSSAEDLLAGAASFAAVQHYIDPADYAVTGKTMVMRLIASFMQNATANAATSTATAGLYPVTAGGTVAAWTPTLGAVVASSTAARTGGAASSEARVVSATFNAPAADTYSLAVAIGTATTAGATKISIRLEYSYT